jgi:pimeloyl-ACP methyl ester carboxylesterase
MRENKMKSIILTTLCFIFCFGTISSVIVAQEKETVDPKWEKVLELIEKAPSAIKEFEKNHGHYAEMNGFKLHYLEWAGPSPNSPVLIWMPGGSSTAYEILGFAPYITEAGYRVISVDVRGHGRTQITDFDFTIYDCADDIIQLMNHLKIDKAVIGGFSMGGYIAAAVYHDYKDRVEALLLEEGGHMTIQKAWDILVDIKKDVGDDESLFKGAESPDAPSEFDTLEEYLKVALRPRFNASTNITMDTILVYASMMKQKDNGKWGYAIDGDKVFGPLGENTCRSAHQRPFTVSLGYYITKVVFRKLSVPVLLIEGDEHLLLSREEVEKYGFNDVSDGPWLAQRYPKLVRRVVYKGAGHTTKFERPADFLRDVLEFLSGLKKDKGW